MHIDKIDKSNWNSRIKCSCAAFLWTRENVKNIWWMVERNLYDQFDSHRFALNRHTRWLKSKSWKYVGTHTRTRTKAEKNGQRWQCRPLFLLFVCIFRYQHKQNKQKWYLIHFLLFFDNKHMTFIALLHCHGGNNSNRNSTGPNSNQPYRKHFFFCRLFVFLSFFPFVSVTVGSFILSEILSSHRIRHNFAFCIQTKANEMRSETPFTS